jgi:amino acid transporter
MLRFIALLLIAIVVAAFVAPITNLSTELLLQSIAEQIGSVAFLIVSSIALLMIFVFFLPVLRRAGDRTEIKMHRLSWSKHLNWLLSSIVWVAAAAFVISSFRVVLQISQRVDPNLFWCLIIIFMVILFATAYLEDRKAKRLGNNRVAWWR